MMLWPGPGRVKRLWRIANDFCISDCSLRDWLKQADVENGKRANLTDDECKQLRDANKRIRLLEPENEVLRRAAAYLPEANLPGQSSSRSSTR